MPPLELRGGSQWEIMVQRAVEDGRPTRILLSSLLSMAWSSSLRRTRDRGEMHALQGTEEKMNV